MRHLPQPPVLAFALWVAAMLWACLWRGALRWGAAAPLLAGVALYALAPRPIVLIDGGGQALLAHVRAEGETRAHWAALQKPGGAFERARLGDLAGLSPAAARAAPSPEGCAAALCAWRTPQGRPVFFVRDASGWPAACARGALVLGDVQALPGWRTRCQPSVLLDTAARAARGGAIVTEGAGLYVRYARSARARQAWN
ncbi:MAG: hypothetical protein AB7G04_04890 [Hyphomonadaceae bacterium]